MKAAENAERAVIGVDQDQSYESESVITSAMKNLRSALVYLLDDAQKDGFIGGRVMHLDAAEGAVSLPMATSRFRTFAEADYQAIFEKLAAGEIEVPDETSADSADRLPVVVAEVRVIR